MKRILGLISCAIIALTAAPLMAGTIHVPGDYALINDAVQACASGDTVLVAAGTYTDCTHETEGDGSTPACVIMKSGVTLRGSGKENTIIDAATADEDGRGIFVELVSNCRIENLQVRNAFAEIYGAGILVRQVDSSVEINDVKIFENLDGGIICINNAAPVIRNVDFIDNVAKQGGGLATEEYCDPQIIDCFFDGNSAPSGGAMFIREISAPIMTGCTIQNNAITAAYGSGGGIAVMNSSPLISDCVIEQNESLGYGGGIAYLDNSGGTISDCFILGNIASHDYSYGGGISVSQSAPAIEDCVIAGNSTTGYWSDGGGIEIEFAPYPTVSNCTIVDNSTGPNGLGGGVYCQFSADVAFDNCIIAANTGQAMYCMAASPTVTCSDLYGNTLGDAICGIDGGDNFSADPLLCATAGYEYNLEQESPCAAGNHAGACADELVGARPVGCSVSVDETPVADARLLGNAPNPFNPKTSIFFVLDSPGPASIRIFDVTGRKLATMPLGELQAGQHEAVWNGRTDAGKVAASGVYLYELDALGTKQSRRMILVK